MSIASRTWIRSLVLVAVGAASSLAQEARAMFDAPLVVLPGDNRITHLVDFDQDGWVDALSWWYVNNQQVQIQIRAWINDHSGKFNTNPAWEVPFNLSGTSNTEAQLAVGDIDADGRLDFAAEHLSRINIYRSNGAAAPTLLQTLPGQGATIADLALADINGDGYADLVDHEANWLVRVHLNQGPSMGFNQVLMSSPSVGTPLSVMRIGELTGDGVLDLLFVDAHSIRILPLNADGSFGSMQITTTVNRWYYPRPAIGDVDGDGDDDVVVFDGTGTGFYELLRRTGPSSWSLEPPRVGGPTTELADLDGDGDLDGICCGGGGGPYGTWLNSIGSTFNTCFNDGTGVFSPAFQMKGVGSKHIAGAADVDHDGDIDLVAGRCIYYSRSPLTSSPVIPLPQPVACDQALVDFDDDGDTDLGLSPDYVQRSDGRVTYTGFSPMMPTPPPFSQFFGPGYPGDFDGDGDIDLIVSRFDSGLFAQMELLLNSGGGHYVDGGAAGAPGVSFSLTGDQYLVTRGAIVEDLDGDGDRDLITRTVAPVSSNPSSKVWLNDGQGVFALSQAFPNSSVLAVGTLNADSIPDLVSAYSTSSTPNLFWQAGNGDGTYLGGVFPPGNYFQTKVFVDDIVVEDLDADGDIDIAAVGYGLSSSSLIAWRNDGYGSFIHSWPNTASMFAAGAKRHVVTADLDGNGYRDLITWPPLEANFGCYIFLRTNDGASYQPPILQAVQPLAFRDSDSDGDPDAFALSWTHNDNALVLNTTLSGPTSGARRQYGDGSAGTGGCVPTLGASGIFTVGHTVTIRIRGGLGGAHGILAGSLVPGNAPFLATTPYVWPIRRYFPFTLSGPNGVAGVGSTDIVYQATPAFTGLSLTYQAFISDPGAGNGLSATNGLEIEHD